MNIRYLSFAFLIATNSFLTLQAAETANQQMSEITKNLRKPAIKVQLLQNSEGALVTSKGPYNVYDPKTGKKLDSSYLSSSYYTYPTTDGLKWGQEFPGTYQLLIVPDKAATTVMVAGTEYKGVAYIYQIQGRLGAVNEVSLEDFVLSVLSTHVPADLNSKEALAALAIVMRTEVYNAMKQAKNKYWDVKASTFNYQGCAIERHDSPFVEAVRSTRGMILNQSSHARWFQEGQSNAPIKRIEELAQNGKDAANILSQLIPGANISILK